MQGKLAARIGICVGIRGIGMPVVISMLRGVNVGGRNKIGMQALRGLYEALKFEGPRTYV